jgi:hypothetical protein
MTMEALPKFKLFNFLNGPWPICGYCKKNRAANRYWLDNGHNNPKRQDRSELLNMPLIWHDKHVCEICFLSECQQEKRQIISTSFQINIFHNTNGCKINNEFRKKTSDGMHKVINEVRENQIIRSKRLVKK